MCHRTNIIIHHKNVVTKSHRPMTIYFLSRNILIGIAKLYICLVLVNIGNI